MFHVGDVIRKRRAERKLTLKRLAKQADIGKMTLSGIERGVVNYRKDTLDRIALALDTTSDDLRTQANGMVAEPPAVPEDTPSWLTILRNEAVWMILPTDVRDVIELLDQLPGKYAATVRDQIRAVAFLAAAEAHRALDGARSREREISRLVREVQQRESLMHERATRIQQLEAEVADLKRARALVVAPRPKTAVGRRTR